MAFTDDVRNIYIEARSAAARGDVSGAAKGLQDLGELCEKQYNLGVEKTLNRAKLRQYFEKFYGYARYIEEHGLTHQIKVFFGLVEDESLSSFSDVLRGTEKGSPASTEKGVIDDPIDSLSRRGKTPKINKTQNEEDSKSRTNDVKEIPNLPKTNITYSIESREFAPKSLSTFTGQEQIVKRIAGEINAAKIRGEHYLDHILLFGSRGLGKSTLMELIAKELGVRFEYLDCSRFENDRQSKKAVQLFFQRIARENQPVVICFDEIGFCPKSIQSSLLTLLSTREYCWLDNDGKNYCVRIEDFTFIGATTDPQDLLSTLKDRCRNLTFYLQDYTKEEIRKIMLDKFNSLAYDVEEEAIEHCVNRCRSSIREIDAFLKGMKTLATNNDTKCITAAMAEEYYSTARIDSIGLTTYDLAILKALKNEPSGAMSEGTIAAVAGLSKNVYSSEYEPYLLKLGFISISSKGRMLTEKARIHLDENNVEESDSQ